MNERQSDQLQAAQGMSVYDGRRHLADVKPIRGKFVVVLADGETLGRFPNLKMATNAVDRASRREAGVK